MSGEGDPGAGGAAGTVGSGARGPTVADCSETELLELLRPWLPDSPAQVVGTGDDCAVLAAPDGRYVVSTDLLVQGHHFRTDWSSPQAVGRRAAVQNLADVAAMGARPVALVVGLVLPGGTPVDWVVGLAQGMGRCCRAAGAGVVGGDLSAGPAVVVAVTVHGDLQGRAPVLRSGARAGDLLVHVGGAGRSAAGLALLEAGAAGEDGVARQCVEAFRAPTPPLACGPALADAGATAMMDVSDSLVRDAARLAVASDVVVEVDEPAGGGLQEQWESLVPVAQRLGAVQAQRQARQWVLTGGEDHGLLATLPPAALRRAQEAADLAGVRVIGRVRGRGAGERARALVGGRPWTGSAGWDHFRA